MTQNPEKGFRDRLSSLLTADTDTFPVKRKTSNISTVSNNIEFNSENSISNEAECTEEFKIVTDDVEQPRQMSMAVYQRNCGYYQQLPELTNLCQNLGIMQQAYSNCTQLMQQMNGE